MPGTIWLLLMLAGLILRGVGENHDAAHALGYKVRGTRMAAIAIGGYGMLLHVMASLPALLAEAAARSAG